MARFTKGQSGNPAGRPVGITKTTEIRQQLENGCDAVIRKVLEMAEGGDIDAIKMVLDRTCPAPKATTQPILLPPFESNQERLNYIWEAVLNGNIPIEIGVQALSFMGQCKKDIQHQKIDSQFDWTM